MENSRSSVAFLTTPQQPENPGQIPVSGTYLTPHGQSSNILSMLDTALQASAATSTPMVPVGTNLEPVQIVGCSQLSDAGKTLVLNWIWLFKAVG